MLHEGGNWAPFEQRDNGFKLANIYDTIKPSQDPNEHGIFIVANEVHLNWKKYSTLKKNYYTLSRGRYL